MNTSYNHNSFPLHSDPFARALGRDIAVRVAACGAAKEHAERLTAVGSFCITPPFLGHSM